VANYRVIIFCDFSFSHNTSVTDNGQTTHRAINDLQHRPSCSRSEVGRHCFCPCVLAVVFLRSLHQLRPLRALHWMKTRLLCLFHLIAKCVNSIGRNRVT